jgi:hypothetical protein
VRLAVLRKNEMAEGTEHMLTRRYSVLALLVAAACGVAVFAATASRDGAAESSEAAVTGSSIATSEDAPPPQHVQVADGPQPGAFLRPPRVTDAPLGTMPLLAKDVRRVATTRHLGVDQAVYVGRNGKGLTCVVFQEGPLGRGGGGCNPSNGPFLGSNVLWSSTHYNEDPQRLVLFGVVTERVSAVSLAFAGGARTAVPLSEDGGFIYVVTKATIEPSHVPRSLITFDSKGREIEQTALGITFGP